MWSAVVTQAYVCLRCLFWGPSYTRLCLFVVFALGAKTPCAVTSICAQRAEVGGWGRMR